MMPVVFCRVQMVGGPGNDAKSPSMHGVKGGMSPVVRGVGAPGMGAGRNDPAGAREEVGTLLWGVGVGEGTTYDNACCSC